MRRLRVLTWHVHGSYLSYLSRIRHDLYVPVKPGRPDGYGGRSPGRTWAENVHEVPAGEVAHLDVDVVVYQHHRNWLVDRWELLSQRQRSLPSIYLEHDPPRRSPTETRHPVADPNVLIVHVTHFNRLMWESSSPTRVIEHGVVVPDHVRWTGERRRGICVVNNIARRDRRVGPDVFDEARRAVPLDLVGMNATDVGGIGEIPLDDLAEFEAPYRFLFNPIRWTSLGLAVCEAMMIGMPIVGLATTGMVGVVENGVSGYLDNDVTALVRAMRRLLADPAEAAELGRGARETALRRFGIERFVRDWEETLALVTGTRAPVEHDAEKTA